MSMDRSRFEAIVTAYGADPARWPPAERAAALAFAEAHPAFAAPVLARERSLDDLLETARDGPAPHGEVAARLLASIAAQAGQPASPLAPRLPDWAALAAGLALVAGLGLGWGGSALLTEPDAGAGLYLAAFDTLNEETGWSLEETR